MVSKQRGVYFLNETNRKVYLTRLHIHRVYLYSVLYVLECRKHQGTLNDLRKIYHDICLFNGNKLDGIRFLGKEIPGSCKISYKLRNALCGVQRRFLYDPQG